MNRMIPFSAVSILLLLAMCLDCFALYLPISNEDLILISHEVIHGIVKEIKCQWDESHNIIYSNVTIEVLDVFKGEPRDEVVIFTEGGTVGNITVNSSSEPEFEKGMEIIIHTFLVEDGRRTTRNGARGMYEIKDGIVERLDKTLDQFRNFVNEVISTEEVETENTDSQ